MSNLLSSIRVGSPVQCVHAHRPSLYFFAFSKLGFRWHVSSYVAPKRSSRLFSSSLLLLSLKSEPLPRARPLYCTPCLVLSFPCPAHGPDPSSSTDEASFSIGSLSAAILPAHVLSS